MSVDYIKVYVNLSDLSLLPCQLNCSTVMWSEDLTFDGVGMYPLTCLVSISPFNEFVFIHLKC